VDRTLRATLIAGFIGFATVAGLGIFLGFDPTGSLIAGGVTGLIAAGLLWGAARRAETFHPTDEVTPPAPGFPGPPDRPDGSPSDPTHPAFEDDRRDDRD
jgi:hypothetical protein